MARSASMSGTHLKHGPRRALLSVCGFLACLMLVTPAHAEQYPPDQVDPPAEGEGQPLEDPSEPEPSGDYTAQAQPSPSINLSGRTWRRPESSTLRAITRYQRGIQLSRALFPDGAGRVVLVAGGQNGIGLGAASLAATARGPLLMTPPTTLTTALKNEIRRLDPNVVLLVGPMSDQIVAQVRNLGARPERLRGDNRFATSMAVARKMYRMGNRPYAVVVASGDSFAHNQSVAAFAAARRLPVLLTRRNSGNAALRQRVAELGAKRTYIIGNGHVLTSDAVRGLPDKQRIGGTTALATSVALARRGEAMGMSGRPVLASYRAPEHAVLAGAMYGARNKSVLLVNNGRQLSAATQDYLADRSPGHLLLVQNGLSPVAQCQARRGRARSWYCAELELRRQGYHMPHVDGSSDRFSIWAIYAFEKVAGRSANGSFGEAEWLRMLANPRHRVRRPDLPSTHVEIDIGKQLILLVKNGRVRNHLHTSTGKPSTPMVRGTFTVYEKRPYMQANRMYKSIFFHGGYAIHGYPKIPTYPASAGCGRVYNGNADFIYPRVFLGERVATY